MAVASAKVQDQEDVCTIGADIAFHNFDEPRIKEILHHKKNPALAVVEHQCAY